MSSNTNSGKSVRHSPFNGLTKLMPSVLISTFRKRISFHSNLSLILLAVLAIGMFAFIVSIDTFNPFVKGAFSISILIFLFAGTAILDRKSTRLKTLNRSDPGQTIIDLESHIEKERKMYQQTQLLRLIAGVVSLAGFFASLFLKPDAWYNGYVFMGFIGLTLMSMLHGWMLMKDGMMLQDIKHALRDQTSGIS